MSSRFLDEIPADLLEEPQQAVFRAAALSGGLGGMTGSTGRASARAGGGRGWYDRGTTERPASGTRVREPASAGVQFRLGEDVVHAAFGDGVVTGVEPGGVIVVRFADDGSERKLMAEYAPVSRR